MVLIGLSLKAALAQELEDSLDMDGLIKLAERSVNLKQRQQGMRRVKRSVGGSCKAGASVNNENSVIKYENICGDKDELDLNAQKGGYIRQTEG